MVRLSVYYPATPGSRFDWDYYLASHCKLIKDLLSPLGLVEIDVDRGITGFPPSAPVTFHAICHLAFHTVEDLQNAMGAHALQLVGDVPNYTDVQPVLQVNQDA